VTHDERSDQLLFREDNVSGRAKVTTDKERVFRGKMKESKHYFVDGGLVGDERRQESSIVGTAKRQCEPAVCIGIRRVAASHGFDRLLTLIYISLVLLTFLLVLHIAIIGLVVVEMDFLFRPL